MLVTGLRLATMVALMAPWSMALASAAEPVKVATPSRVIFALPYWIAERNGYFKDEGIEATLAVGGRTGELTNQLRTGAIQIHIGGPDGVLIDASKGGPLRILAGVVRKPPLFLVAKPSIKTFAGLRGAHIGVLSLTEGSSKLLARMLRAEGIAASDVKITAVGGAPARHGLLKGGKIDAGMQPLPLSYAAEAAGFNNLGWAGKYEPDWQFITVNADGRWAQKNAQAATGFLRALLRGQAFIWANPKEAARIAADVLKTDEASAARALADAVRLGILDPRLDWSETGLQRIYASKQADGAIAAGAFAIGRIADAQYLRKAQESVPSRR